MWLNIYVEDSAIAQDTSVHHSRRLGVISGTRQPLFGSLRCIESLTIKLAPRPTSDFAMPTAPLAAV